MSRLTNTIAELGLQYANPEVRKMANELWEQDSFSLGVRAQKENALDYGLLPEESNWTKPYFVIALIRAHFAGQGVEALVKVGDAEVAPRQKRERTHRERPTNAAGEPEEDGAVGVCEWCRKKVHNGKLRFIQPNWLELPVHVCSACAKGIDEFERERKLTVSAHTGYRANAVGAPVISTFPPMRDEPKQMTGEDLHDHYAAHIRPLQSLGRGLKEVTRVEGANGSTVTIGSSKRLEYLRSLSKKLR